MSKDRTGDKQWTAAGTVLFARDARAQTVVHLAKARTLMPLDSRVRSTRRLHSGWPAQAVAVNPAGVLLGTRPDVAD